MEFSEAIQHILKSEGGYVNDPDDMGGETNYGITKRVAVANGYNETMKDIPMSVVEDIYFNDYWLKAHCDKLPNKVRLMHFDTAVNMGVSRANKFLQESIGAYIDGIVGKNTLAKAGKCDLKKYSRVRLVYYVKIIINKPVQVKYINGWFNRVLDILIHSK